MKNLFDLTGKVAIVIGGSRGLGRGMATGLLNAGAKVVIASRNAEAVEQAAKEIRYPLLRDGRLPADSFRSRCFGII